MTVGLSTILVPNFKEPVVVEAANVINQTQGVVTVNASSLWTYSRADWNARTKAFSKGTQFTVLEKLGVAGREMYRLSNGLYISANPSYVSFQGSGTSNPTPAPVNQGSSVVSKTTVNLNMRRGSGTKYGIVLTIPKGAQVTVLSASNGWSNVSYNGKTGWVSSKYLTAGTTSQPAPSVPAPSIPAVPSGTGTGRTTANLNMRKGNSTRQGIILTIPKGREVTILSTSNGWSNVSYNGKTGWVSSQYLAIVTAPAPQQPAPSVPSTPSVLGTSKTTANLNMRKGSSTKQGIILTIPKGREVTVISSSNGWSNVSYNGKTGWVSSTYLTALVPVTPPVVTPPVIVVPEPPVTPVPPVVPEVPVTPAPPVVPEKPVEVPVVVKPAVLLVDNIKSLYNNENIIVSGLALTMDGIKSVTATIDGNEVAVERIERPDMHVIYGEGYNLSNIGFRLNIDKSTLSAGKHSVVIKATANDGSVKDYANSFKLTKPTAAITLNGLTDGQAVPSGNVNVSGYAVNVDGVSEVRYYVNDINKGAVAYGSASGEASAYASYTGYANAGYNFTLNAADLSSTGMNAVRVELTGKDGTKYSKTVLLKGSNTSRYIAEAQAKTRDQYAAVEYGKGAKIYSNGSFIDATPYQVQYHMDPANFIHHSLYKYMFMDLRYTVNQLDIDAAKLDNMLAGKGSLNGTGAYFLKAAETHGINPFYLIAHALLETGHGKSVLSNGQLVKDTYTKFGDASTIVPDSIPLEDREKLVYNVFGIGAYDSNPELWGAQKAYELKWFTIEDAIVGGAKWISDGYLNRTAGSQNTLFKMRYNFPDNMIHQYATDVAWAKSQSGFIKTQVDAYNKANGTDIDLVYIYPTFK